MPVRQQIIRNKYQMEWAYIERSERRHYLHDFLYYVLTVFELRALPGHNNNCLAYWIGISFKKNHMIGITSQRLPLKSALVIKDEIIN